MKKLTWLFLSLMLVLGMGTAFAQNREGETPTTPEVPAPTFNPDGGTVVVYSRIVLTNGTESDETPLKIYYNFEAEGNDAYFTNITTREALEEELDKESSERKVNECPKTGVTLSKSQPTSISAATAKIDEDGNITWSTVITKNFTVKTTAPTFKPSAGFVAKGTKITTTASVTKIKAIYFNVDGSDADFDLTYAQLEGTSLTKYDQETENLPEITSDMTFRAAFAQLDTLNKTVSWSVITTVEYKVVDRPTAPTFSPDGGEITESDQITLTNGTEGDDTPLEIYYTKKGEASVFATIETETQLNSAKASGWSQKLWLYEEPLTIDKETTIHAATAKIVEGKVIWSEPVTKSFTLEATGGDDDDDLVAPTFTPDGGEIGMDDGIEISTTTAGARVYYDVKSSTFAKLKTEEELDAEANNMNSQFSQYSSSMKPSLEELGGTTPGAKVSISAAAVLIAADGTLTWSEVTTKEFTVKAEEGPVEDVAKPTITPGNDVAVHMGDKVTITCATEGAEIYYTTNNSTPYNIDKDGNPVSIKDGDTVFKYTEPFELTQEMLVRQRAVWSLRIRAVAIKDGKLSMGSSVGYIVYPNTPTFSVTGKVMEGTKVAIKCVPDSADIYYTTDGSTPTMEDGILYTDSIEITAATTIKALAVLGQYQSSVVTASYTVVAVADPTFSVAAGEVEKGTKVEIACVTEDAAIYYTVDGTEPTAESTEYTAEISIDSAMTIKAIAVKGEDTSNVVEAAYTIKGEGPVVVEKDTLPMPKFSVAAGEVEKGTTVVLSCDTADAKIYYSINADTVTENSLEYTAAIAIDSAMTIRAIAVKEGLENSPVAVAAYTIKGEGTANEGKELTGVSVYPNPSTGVFHIELPVAATVEVFASTGVLVRSFNAAAGKSTLSLDHSGIYFVRIMGEGRATVKRVIVR